MTKATSPFMSSKEISRKPTSNKEFKVDGLAGATITSRGVDNMIHYWLGKNGFELFLKNVPRRESSKKLKKQQTTPKNNSLNKIQSFSFHSNIR